MTVEFFLLGGEVMDDFGQKLHPECSNVNIFLMSFWRFISTQLAKPVPQAFENVGKSWNQIRLIFRLSSCIGNPSCSKDSTVKTCVICLPSSFREHLKNSPANQYMYFPIDIGNFLCIDILHICMHTKAIHLSG